MPSRSMFQWRSCGQSVVRRTGLACLLQRVLERNATDPECVWRCILAFERVGDAADIERVRALAVSIVEIEHDKDLPARAA